MRLDFVKIREKILNTPTQDLDLSLRAYNCVRAAKIETVRELINHSREQLLSHRNFGQKSVAEVEQVLEEMNLRLRNKNDFMKLELVTEQNLTDEGPKYYLYLDGKYIEGSFTTDLEKAKKNYERVFNNPDLAFSQRIVLQSEEIIVSSNK